MWKKISSKIVFKHPRLTLIEDEVELPTGEVVPYLTFEHKNDGVTIICLNDKNQLLLQEEYSYPPNKRLYQFPGGKTEPGESPEESARRELREESGLEANDLTELGWYYTNNRRSAEKMYVFLARNPAPCKKEGGDLEEDITSTWITTDDFTQLIAQGDITNFSVLAAWTLYHT
jgi:8-oxo-dGTP pyrophosphatase MutT (NUDIX family)